MIECYRFRSGKSFDGINSLIPSLQEFRDTTLSLKRRQHYRAREKRLSVKAASAVSRTIHLPHQTWFVCHKRPCQVLGIDL
jgi:hypothetical protein